MRILYKKLVFQISFLLQTKFAFFRGDDETSGGTNIYKIELEKWFGPNFDNLINLTDVLVWKISIGQKPFKCQDYSKGFTEFGMTETFLIFAQNWNGFFTLYYWVGTETTLEDKIFVAEYAMFFKLMLSSVTFDNIMLKLTREEEMFESESFIDIVNRLRRTPKPVNGRIGPYRDGHFPLNGPNLYLVTKNRIRSIIKIPVSLGLKLLTHDICLVVDILPDINVMYPASTYCVAGADSWVQWRAQSLVHFRYKLIEPETIIRGSYKYNVLIELLENKQYYRVSESDYVQDGIKIISDEAEVVLLSKLKLTNVDGEQVVFREPVKMNPIDITRIDVASNYILDTKSVAGIYFVFGNMTNSHEIIRAIGYAEKYLHDEILSQGRAIRMRITTILTTLPTDLQINSIPPREEEFFRIKWNMAAAPTGYYL